MKKIKNRTASLRGRSPKQSRMIANTLDCFATLAMTRYSNNHNIEFR